MLDKKLPFVVFTIFGVIGIIFTSVGLCQYHPRQSSLISTILSISVPESKGLPLAETRGDIVSLVREFRYFSWVTWGASDRDREISQRNTVTATSGPD